MLKCPDLFLASRRFVLIFQSESSAIRFCSRRLTRLTTSKTKRVSRKLKIWINISFGMHSNGEVSSSDRVLTFKFGPDESILACRRCSFFFLLRSENFNRPTSQRFFWLFQLRFPMILLKLVGLESFGRYPYSLEQKTSCLVSLKASM